MEEVFVEIPEEIKCWSCGDNCSVFQIKTTSEGSYVWGICSFCGCSQKIIQIKLAKEEKIL